MHRILFIISALVITLLPATAQQTGVGVTNEVWVEDLSWSVSDSSGNIIITSEAFNSKEAYFLLDLNKRYFLNISLSENFPEVSELMTLSVNYTPIIVITGLIEPGDHSYPFFTSEINSSKKIIGGINADIADFPWQVFFRTGAFVCGGSIIGKNWIVTAAHCTFDDNEFPINPANMYIKVGATAPRVSGTGRIYEIEEVIVHENYDHEVYTNDIALLKLKDSIDFENAEVIELISKQDSIEGFTDPGIISWVTGWGLTNVNPEEFPDFLQKVQLPIVSGETAATVWGPRPGSMLMAGYSAGTKDACSGDSGGPLVVDVNGKYKLAGIVSWGNSNCNTFGAYTRISSFYDWIRLATGINDTYKPQKPTGRNVICEGDKTDNYSTNFEPLASNYKWRLLPDSAGSIEFLENNARIDWNPDYRGDVKLEVRNTVDGIISSWTDLEISLARNTRINYLPADTFFCAGFPMEIIVDAVGHNLGYTWSVNGSTILSNTPGRIYYYNPTANQSGIYKLELSGSCDTVVSDDINVIVHPVTRITSQPGIVNAGFGKLASIEIETEGYDLSYRWEKDGAVLEGNDEPFIVFDPLDASHLGLYKVNVQGSCGEETSGRIYLYSDLSAESMESPAALWPTITSGPFQVAVKDARKYSVSIFNSDGVLIGQISDRQYITEFDLSGYSGGLYFIRITGNELNEVLRLFISGGKY